MEQKYFIYRLTNTVNSKIYIGKTKRRICSRMSDHRYFSKKLNPKQPISRAIAKYGWDSFSVEILKECLTEEEMNQCESEFILKFNSVNRSIGYNVCSEIQDHRFSNSEYFKSIEKHASQGRKSYNSKYSKYIGTRWWANGWYCQCKIDGKNISKKCSNEVEAAILYDKICLFHYGISCKLNFENSRLIYLSENLKDIFNEFVNIKHSSKESHVCYDKSRNKWLFSKRINNKRIFKRFNTEIEAINYKNNCI